ncbi:hypothetical protein [Kamptonema formosum]|uniref:hypothetical protein n=1 Tax=Kamptonema formosum TaxID=331992 RepID=UPI00034D4D25|nr:hypothetical protein [Oscillatoria sp. PCC 10802]
MLEIHKNYLIDENQQPVAVQITLAEFEKISSALEKIKTDEERETDTDVEKDMMVRMEPLSQRQVKVRVRHLGRAKPRVIYDPLSLD